MIIEKLQHLQQAYNWTQAQMAQELGISRPLLTSIYSGKRNISLKTMKGIIARFPELKQQVQRLLEGKEI